MRAKQHTCFVIVRLGVSDFESSSHNPEGFEGAPPVAESSDRRSWAGTWLIASKVQQEALVTTRTVGSNLNRSPLLNPVTPDLKVGIFHLTAGSRKELRFVLNRSFHVQLSVWPIAIVKVNIFVQNLFQLLRCFVKMMVEGFFF